MDENVYAAGKIGGERGTDEVEGATAKSSLAEAAVFS